MSDTIEPEESKAIRESRNDGASKGILKPCPFCGSEPTTSTGFIDLIRFCICEGCGISVLADKWNTRSGTIDLKPTIELLEWCHESLTDEGYVKIPPAIQTELARLRKESGE